MHYSWYKVYVWICCVWFLPTWCYALYPNNLLFFFQFLWALHNLTLELIYWDIYSWEDWQLSWMLSTCEWSFSQEMINFMPNWLDLGSLLYCRRAITLQSESPWGHCCFNLVLYKENLTQLNVFPPNIVLNWVFQTSQIPKALPFRYTLADDHFIKCI